MKKYAILLSLFIFPNLVFSNENEQESIPFIVNKYGSGNNNYRMSSDRENGKPGSAELKIDIPISKIEDLIKTTKKTICNAVDNKANVTIWIKVDASAKMVGIGAAGESGIEVTFECNK